MKHQKLDSLLRARTRKYQFSAYHLQILGLSCVYLIHQSISRGTSLLNFTNVSFVHILKSPLLSISVIFLIILFSLLQPGKPLINLKTSNSYYQLMCIFNTILDITSLELTMIPQSHGDFQLLTCMTFQTHPKPLAFQIM